MGKRSRQFRGVIGRCRWRPLFRSVIVLGRKLRIGTAAAMIVAQVHGDPAQHLPAGYAGSRLVGVAAGLLAAARPVHAPAVSLIQRALRAVDVAHLAPHTQFAAGSFQQCDRAQPRAAATLVQPQFDGWPAGR